MSRSQNRFTSPVVWLSVIILIINQFSLHELVGINNESLKIVIDSIITILVTLGIINNPTSKSHF